MKSKRKFSIRVSCASSWWFCFLFAAIEWCVTLCVHAIDGLVCVCRSVWQLYFPRPCSIIRMLCAWRHRIPAGTICPSSPHCVSLPCARKLWILLDSVAPTSMFIRRFLVIVLITCRCTNICLSFCLRSINAITISIPFRMIPKIGFDYYFFDLSTWKCT